MTMADTILLKEEKEKLTCDVPITKGQWLDILHDKDLVGPVWRRALLSFYYMPNHRATCKQCVEKYGGNINTYNSAVSSIGEAIVKKLGTFNIEDSKGNTKFWPVIMSEGKTVKGTGVFFKWTLRPELVDALREYIIEDALSKYTADFTSKWKQEEYKWIAVGHFQKNWDLDSENFIEMLESSLSKTDNLLASNNFFPRKMIAQLAKAAPGKVKEMFTNLYDESINVESRIRSFIDSAEKLRIEYNPGDWGMHYQNTNSVSTYLWLRYPEKYYIYKYGEVRDVNIKLGLDFGIKRNGKASEMLKGMRMYDILHSAIGKDMEYQELVKKYIAENRSLYPDPNLHTSTIDFGFWVSRYYTPLIAMHQPKTWLYAPGEGAKMWPDCKDNNLISIGWEEVGDLTGFDTKDELDMAVDKVFPEDPTTMTNSKRCLWDFSHEMDEGDIVYAKQGLYSILGRGIVESGYIYDPTRKLYPNVRRVKWTHIGKWDINTIVGSQLPQKTLTDMSNDTAWKKKVEDVIVNGPVVSNNDMVAEPDPNREEPRYWWLVASPKYWSFADLKVGEKVDYTVKNENGNRRRVPINFEQAREGDIVIGYEAYPVKKIVAFAKVAKASDGDTISYVKTEELIAPVSWFDFKDKQELSEMEFIKNRNGSFFKLTQDEYDVLLDLIRQENPEPENNPIQNRVDLEKYDKADFLNEVFMTSEAFDELTALLKLKQNVILQGAPGVGKTFSAKRIAYAMMGEKDSSRIEMVQFHQNYSYEDFIMGYKPLENGGFEMKNGVFYNFCKRAEVNKGKPYFFIIDEINRGNLSKIFGELLMLIEKDYRGTEIKLAYRNELFTVPENLYIMGMMNTADRSLAMIDYALRRRFSFYSMKPGLDTDGFKEEMAKHYDERIQKVVDAVKVLNDKIAKDDSLGEGFCIGHSYFCGKKSDESWIDSVVKYDLCPMLDEYWFDSKETCKSEKDKLLDIIK
jgi:5-methylcytosine-specific restriction protein B